MPNDTIVFIAISYYSGAYSVLGCASFVTPKGRLLSNSQVTYKFLMKRSRRLITKRIQQRPKYADNSLATRCQRQPLASHISSEHTLTPPQPHTTLPTSFSTSLPLPSLNLSKNLHLRPFPCAGRNAGHPDHRVGFIYSCDHYQLIAVISPAPTMDGAQSKCNSRAFCSSVQYLLYDSQMRTYNCTQSPTQVHSYGFIT